MSSPGVGWVKASRRGGEVAGEVPLLFWLAVEGDDGDAVGDIGDEGFEQGGDTGIVGEMARGGGADLKEDDEGDGLAFEVVKMELLGLTVVEEAESPAR